MAYDHSKKIGNQGDVVKHAVLAHLVARMLKDTKGKDFVYAESHTGHPEYILPNGGQWTDGIKILGEKLNKNCPQSLSAYFDSGIKGGVNIASRYLGSSGLVFSLLLKYQQSHRFVLYENDALAWGDLVRYFGPWPSVSVIKDDGYAGVLGLQRAHLVLIDPPDLKFPDRIITLMKHLKQNKIPFICWTPRIGNSKKPTAEASAYTEFRNSVKKKFRIESILVQWHKNWRTQTCGCVLHVWPKEYHDSANKVVDDLKGLLGWE